MIKNFVKHGNSWAIVIDRPILDLLKINPEQPVELSTDGKTMTITPIEAHADNSRIQEARKKINERYKSTFQTLAEGEPVAGQQQPVPEDLPPGP